MASTAATVRAYEDTGATITSTDADSADGASLYFGDSDAVNSSVSVLVPAITGTNYSYYKNVYLDVTVSPSPSTTMLNRTIALQNVSWAASTGYGMGALVVPATANGHVYVCTGAGTSGASAPSWPTGSGASVTDNTVTWTEAGAGPCPTGMLLHFKANTGAYVEGTAPASSGSNGAVPSGYTQLTTSPQSYDTSSVSTASTGKNGAYVEIVMGIDNTYPFAAGQPQCPQIVLSYTEQGS